VTTHASARHVPDLDADNPLSGRRALFDLPEGLVYLCGNSLGPLPRAVPGRVSEVLRQEWGQGLIGSWNTAGWTGIAARVASRLAPLVGADACDITLGDSTSVTLFKAMVAAARLRPERRVLLVEPTTFPTDGYVAAGVARLLDLELRWADPLDPRALDEDVAVVAPTHVDFRTGAMYDLAGLTGAAHDVGAVTVWDLCHSVGAVPVDLTAAQADFAVGCTYKYLNGGPGAPAFAWVSPALSDGVDQPITGWWGHSSPFAMSRDFTPAAGAARMNVGTPPVLALAALDAALTAFDGVPVPQLRSVSLSLTDLFIKLVESRLGPEVEVLTPRTHSRRGSQVALRHPEAYGVVQALIARGVVGDFRSPDVARFGFAPLFVSHADVHRAVEELVAVLQGGEHLNPAYSRRKPIT